MDAAFIQARIDATKLQIVEAENASLAIATGSIESYDLDTGQTRQKVIKLDIQNINNVIDSLYNRCATLEARLNGSGVTTVRPSW